MDGDGDENEARFLNQQEMSEFFAEHRRMSNLKVLRGGDFLKCHM